MKKLISLLLITAFLISFSGCSVPQPENEGSVSTGFYPVTLTDHAGREVTIEEEPQRLISCYYITTSLLMALDLDDKLVGIENDPELRPIYELSNPNLLELSWARILSWAFRGRRRRSSPRPLPLRKKSAFPKSTFSPFRPAEGRPRGISPIP